MAYEPLASTPTPSYTPLARSSSQPNYAQPPQQLLTPQFPSTTVSGSTDPLNTGGRPSINALLVKLVQGTAGTLARVGKTILPGAGDIAEQLGVGQGTPAYTSLYGTKEPIKSIPATFADLVASQNAANAKLPSYPALAITGKETQENQPNPHLQAAGQIAFDVGSLTPLGAEGDAIKALTATKDLSEAAKIGRTIGISEDLLPSFSQAITKTSKDAETKKILDSFANLQTTSKPTLETGDKMLLTDKATGKTQERFVYQSPKNGLLVKDAVSGIPKKLNLDTFDVKVLEKNSPEYPKFNTLSINSPEMIALEEKETLDKIAASTNPTDIEKLLQDTGVDKAQIPQMARVLAGVDNPKKVKNIIEGFDITRTPRVSKPQTPLQVELAVRKDMLEQHPAKGLLQYVNKQTGQLPEVVGSAPRGSNEFSATSKFGQKGDAIVTEHGFQSPEAANKSVQELRQQKEEYRGLLAQSKQKPSESSSLPQNPAPRALSQGEAKSLEIQAHQAQIFQTAEQLPSHVSLPEIISHTVTPVQARVNIIDTFLRTPNRVMQKIGFGPEAKALRTAMDGYWKELPKNLDKISQWSKEVSVASNERIFKYLDGQAVTLLPQEQKVANEIKIWLREWADRLELPADKRISDYITRIFDKDFGGVSFPEEIAKLIADKLPGSVYNPFTLKRLGTKGYLENTWKALDAYVKRGTRQAYLDPVLEKIKAKAGSSLDIATIEKSQWQYLKKYIDNINMRPSELDESIDNVIRGLTSRLGQRPVTTLARLLRQATFRGTLGLNFSSALRNLSQGVNTYAKLGERYTAVGYAGLLKRGAKEELEREGVLNAGFIQDKVLSATRKNIQRVDAGLFYFFDKAEQVNRGAAYFGAKAKALATGKTEAQAIVDAKEVVRKTQFVFDSVDTPVGMQGDIMKTLFQFQSYTTKQIEFLTEMAKDKNFLGLLRYAAAGTTFVYTVGKAFGMEPKELLPWYRFDVPASLKFPTETTKALLDAPDKYSKQRSVAKKLSDVGKSGIGLIPAGVQANKSIQGYQAVKAGQSSTSAGKKQFSVGGTLLKNSQAILFGKYATPEGKAYIQKLTNPPPKASTKKKKSTPSPYSGNVNAPTSSYTPL